MSEDERSGSYYENQFGDRIRAIGRGGPPPRVQLYRPSTPTPAGGLKIAGGVGGLILIILIFGGLRAWRTSPSYYVTPALPILPLQVPQPNPWLLPDGNGNEIFAQDPFNPNRPFQIVPGGLQVEWPDVDEAPLLLLPESIGDLPALCYLLHMEGKHTEFTPARCVFERLDEASRKLLREIATEPDNELAPAKRDEMLNALNNVFSKEDFYDARYFEGLDLDEEFCNRLTKWTQPGGIKSFSEARLINRTLMEAALPHQIVPRADQPLKGAAQRAFVDNARQELKSLRKKYGNVKP